MLIIRFICFFFSITAKFRETTITIFRYNVKIQPNVHNVKFRIFIIQHLKEMNVFSAYIFNGSHLFLRQKLQENIVYKVQVSVKASYNVQLIFDNLIKIDSKDPKNMGLHSEYAESIVI